jgi:MSHA biogenesis protein MshP
MAMKLLTQRGFSIVSGIFLLVVLGLLGAVMLNLSAVMQTTSAQDIQGARAYLAAQGGIEWGMYNVLQVPPPPAAAPACPPPTNLALGSAGNTFNVAVQCTALPFTEGTESVTVYRIVSTASFGTAGTSTYVERQLDAMVSR